MGRTGGAHGRCERGGSCCVCSQGPYGGDQAKSASGAAAELDGGFALHPGPEAGYRDAGRVEGDVQGMGHHDHEGGALYRYPVPPLGVDEGVEEAEDGSRGGVSRGERPSGECGRRCGSGVDYAPGCAEDEDDAREGEAGSVAAFQAHMERIGTESVRRRDRSEDHVDLGRWSHLLR